MGGRKRNLIWGCQWKWAYLKQSVGGAKYYLLLFYVSIGKTHMVSICIRAPSLFRGLAAEGALVPPLVVRSIAAWDYSFHHRQTWRYVKYYTLAQRWLHHPLLQNSTIGGYWLLPLIQKNVSKKHYSDFQHLEHKTPSQGLGDREKGILPRTWIENSEQVEIKCTHDMTTPWDIHSFHCLHKNAILARYIN